MEGNQQDNGIDQQPGNAPLRIMKSQLNFFMTRLLFMQEQEADSLGARATANARRLNASNSSMNHSSGRINENGGGNNGNNGGGGIGIVSDNGVGHAANNAALLGSYFDEPEPSDDICVYNDNAKMLPNSRAVSYPPVPFPKAAPESPKQVEGRDGVKIVTPTHQTVDPLKVKAAELPQLPFSDMALDDDDVKEDTMEESEVVEKMVTEEEVVVPRRQVVPTLVPAEDTMQEEDDDGGRGIVDDNDGSEDEEVEVPMESAAASSKSSSPTSKPAGGGTAAVSRKSVSAIPAEARVFPKNQRRSKRYSTRGPVKRSQSLGRKSDSDSVVSDDVSLPNMSTGSYH